MVSPWAAIGHSIFLGMARRHDVAITFKPVSLGEVFAETGGLPLPKRHPVRQRYRLMELQRWRAKRGLDLKQLRLEPFPAAPDGERSDGPEQ